MNSNSNSVHCGLFESVVVNFLYGITFWPILTHTNAHASTHSHAMILLTVTCTVCYVCCCCSFLVVVYFKCDESTDTQREETTTLCVVASIPTPMRMPYTHPITVAMCACKTLPLSSLTCVSVRVLHMIFSHINAHTHNSHWALGCFNHRYLYHRANTHTHANATVCVFENERETHNSGHTSTKRHSPWATNIRKHFLFTSFVRMRHERSSRSLGLVGENQ